jgi:hypothetical protein
MLRATISAQINSVEIPFIVRRETNVAIFSYQML